MTMLWPLMVLAAYSIMYNVVGCWTGISNCLCSCDYQEAEKLKLSPLNCKLSTSLFFRAFCSFFVVCGVPFRKKLLIPLCFVFFYYFTPFYSLIFYSVLFTHNSVPNCMFAPVLMSAAAQIRRVVHWVVISG